MKVLQFISSGGFFGAENVVLQLAEGLQVRNVCQPLVGVVQNDHNPHVELLEACASRGLEAAAVRCRGRLDPALVRRLRNLVKSRGIDLVHSHGYKSNLYARLATAGLRTARVATCHNWLGESAKMRGYAALDRWVLRGFHRIVAVSGPVKTQLLASGVPAYRVSIINNGVSTASCSPRRPKLEVRRSLGIPEDSVVVGTVGRVSPEKGHRVLLEAIAGLLAKHPRLVVLIVGDGGLLENLKGKFSAPWAVFPGLRRDIWDLYGAMDIFGLPSLTEGLPMALLEALSSGLPAVATRVGQVPEVLSGGCGLVVEPGDAEALAQAISVYLASPDEARAAGERGRDRVAREYSRDAMVERYERVYAEAQDERGYP
ncbi:MAG: glycosyltransferase [Deltaproteobacteria bacterium]|nr:glycosyltransferase [Deltaproteobacteria bacterium]